MVVGASSGLFLAGVHVIQPLPGPSLALVQPLPQGPQRPRVRRGPRQLRGLGCTFLPLYRLYTIRFCNTELIKHVNTFRHYHSLYRMCATLCDTTYIERAYTIRFYVTDVLP